MKQVLQLSHFTDEETEVLRDKILLSLPFIELFLSIRSMTADKNSVIYYILDIIRKQCEVIRIWKESLSQSLILEGRMDDGCGHYDGCGLRGGVERRQWEFEAV